MKLHCNVFHIFSQLILVNINDHSSKLRNSQLVKVLNVKIEKKLLELTFHIHLLHPNKHFCNAGAHH